MCSEFMKHVQPFQADSAAASPSPSASMDPPLQTLAADDLLAMETEEIPDDTPEYRKGQPFDSPSSVGIPSGGSDQHDSAQPDPPSAEAEKPSSSLMPPPPPPCREHKKVRMEEIRWGVSKYPTSPIAG